MPLPLGPYAGITPILPASIPTAFLQGRWVLENGEKIQFGERANSLPQERSDSWIERMREAQDGVSRRGGHHNRNAQRGRGLEEGSEKRPLSQDRLPTKTNAWSGEREREPESAL